MLDPQALRDAERGHLPRPKVLDNLLKAYAGTHYQYDARGNMTRRWRDGRQSRYVWNLFDRLTRYEDDRLTVEYARLISQRKLAHQSADARGSIAAAATG